MKKITEIFLLVLITTIPLLAQGGSIYSGYGIGDIQTSFSARRFALGELGFALNDRDYLNALNPASWAEMRMTRYELSLNYSGSKLENSTQSVYHDNVHFNGFIVGFPVERELGISFATGVVPYSNVHYDVKRTLNNNLTGNYDLEDKGEGGIQRFFVGTTYKLPFGFTLGINYDYYFGKVESSTLAYFPDSSGYSNSSFAKISEYHGMSFTTGLISGDISKLFGQGKIKDFRFGLTFTPEVTMGLDTVDNSTTTIGTVETSTGSVKTKVPYRLGLGSAFTYDDNYTFLVDYLYQPYSQFRQNGLILSTMQDFYKFSVGFEYRNSDLRATSFWDYIMLRAGLSYEQTPFKINGTGISQYSVYGGFSIPLAFDNSIDFGFQYGRRGTKDNGLILENIYKFTVSISFGELWFIRQDR